MNLKHLLAFALAGWAMSAAADTIKFKDGSSWEGEIISQSGTEIEMSVELSGGKITTRRTANRSDVAQIILSTPAEKMAKEEQKEYQRAIKNQLHPQSSFTKDYYDKIITGTFDKFLDIYPSSAHAAEIRVLREKWVEERNQVNQGLAKHRGEWKPAAEVKETILKEQTDMIFAQAQSLTAQGYLDAAVQRLVPLTSTNNYPQHITERALAQLTEIYKLQVPQLESQLDQVKAELNSLRDELDEANRHLDAAQRQVNASAPKGSAFRSWGTGGGTSGKRGQRRGRGGGGDGSTKTLGSGGQTQSMGAHTSLINARNEVSAIESKYIKLQRQEQTLEARLSSSSSMMARLGIDPIALDETKIAQATEFEPVPEAPPPAPAPQEEEEEEEDEEDVMGIGGWFKNNWGFVLLGAAVLLYLMNRFTRN